MKSLYTRSCFFGGVLATCCHIRTMWLKRSYIYDPFGVTNTFVLYCYREIAMGICLFITCFFFLWTFTESLNFHGDIMLPLLKILYKLYEFLFLVDTNQIKSSKDAKFSSYQFQKIMHIILDIFFQNFIAKCWWEVSYTNVCCI